MSACPHSTTSRQTVLWNYNIIYRPNDEQVGLQSDVVSQAVRG